MKASRTEIFISVSCTKVASKQFPVRLPATVSQVASVVSCQRTTEKEQNLEEQLAGLSYLQNYFFIFHLMAFFKIYFYKISTLFYKYELSQYSQDKNRNAYYLRIIFCTSLHSTQKSLHVTNKYQCCFKLVFM